MAKPSDNKFCHSDQLFHTRSDMGDETPLHVGIIDRRAGATLRDAAVTIDHRPSRTSLGRGVRNRAPPSAIISKKLEGFFQKSRGVNANSVKRVALPICLLVRSGATR